MPTADERLREALKRQQAAGGASALFGPSVSLCVANHNLHPTDALSLAAQAAAVSTLEDAEALATRFGVDAPDVVAHVRELLASATAVENEALDGNATIGAHAQRNLVEHADRLRSAALDALQRESRRVHPFTFDPGVDATAALQPDHDAGLCDDAAIDVVASITAGVGFVPRTAEEAGLLPEQLAAPIDEPPAALDVVPPIDGVSVGSEGLSLRERLRLFLSATNAKRDAEAILKDAKRRIAELEGPLMDALTDQGITSVKIDGATIFFHKQKWAKIAYPKTALDLGDGEDGAPVGLSVEMKRAARARAVAALNAAGFGEFITIETQGLSSALRERETSGLALPPEFDGAVDWYEKVSLRSRRSSAKLKR